MESPRPSHEALRVRTAAAIQKFLDDGNKISHPTAEENQGAKIGKPGLVGKRDPLTPKQRDYISTMINKDMSVEARITFMFKLSKRFNCSYYDVRRLYKHRVLRGKK